MNVGAAATDFLLYFPAGKVAYQTFGDVEGPRDHWGSRCIADLGLVMLWLNRGDVLDAFAMLRREPLCVNQHSSRADRWSACLGSYTDSSCPRDPLLCTY